MERIFRLFGPTLVLENAIEWQLYKTKLKERRIDEKNRSKLTQTWPSYPVRLTLDCREPVNWSELNARIWWFFRSKSNKHIPTDRRQQLKWWKMHQPVKCRRTISRVCNSFESFHCQWKWSKYQWMPMKNHFVGVWVFCESHKGWQWPRTWIARLRRPIFARTPEWA